MRLLIVLMAVCMIVFVCGTIETQKESGIMNLDEFFFKMIRTGIVAGVHKPENQANKYTQEELMLMKTQDIGYILQKLE
ncbi:hypothetical protein SLE2022_061250 [Rubroshorea leprosula]